jgi:hypothetical protein
VRPKASTPTSSCEWPVRGMSVCALPCACAMGLTGADETACPLTQTAVHALRSLHAREDDDAAVAVLGAVDCGSTFDTVLRGLSPQAKRTLYTAAVDHLYNTLLGPEEVSRAKMIVQRLKSST